MKTLSTQLRTAIADSSTFLTRIWRLTLANGTVFLFTDLSNDILVGSETFKADPGIRLSALQVSMGGTLSNATIEIGVNQSSITEDMLRRGGVDNALVEVWLVSWRNPAYGTILFFKGNVTDIRVSDRNLAMLEVRGQARSVTRTLGEFYSPQCRANLGDGRCKFSLATVRKNFTVDSVFPDGMGFSASLLTEPAAYYDFGAVTWVTGDNTNIVSDVRYGAPGSIALHLPTPFPIKAGDTGTIVPGCDKQLSTCKNKFANELNFRGEPYVPGTIVYAYPEEPPPPAAQPQVTNPNSNLWEASPTWINGLPYWR